MEYDLPDYTGRGRIVQPHSDGSIEAVYGTRATVTVHANKSIKNAEFKIVKLKMDMLHVRLTAETAPVTVGGEFARAIIQLKDVPTVAAYYLKLGDEYGTSNDDASRSYRVVVTRDQPPKIDLVVSGLPQIKPGREEHLLDQRVNTLGAVVRASDDYGVSKLTLHYRVEDLDSNVVKRATRGDEWEGSNSRPRRSTRNPGDAAGRPTARRTATPSWSIRRTR